MFNTDEIISFTKSLLSYGYNPKEFIFFFNPKDVPVETMQEVAEKLGGIEFESADYLIDGKIYILKKKDIDEFNLTWDKYGNRIEKREKK